MSGSGRTPIYGPEPWKREGDAVWSYWDLWFCVVAVADHDGDLDLLADAITDGGRAFLSTTVEAKLSHLDDLAAGSLPRASTFARWSAIWTPTRASAPRRGPRCSTRACIHAI